MSKPGEAHPQLGAALLPMPSAGRKWAERRGKIVLLSGVGAQLKKATEGPGVVREVSSRRCRKGVAGIAFLWARDLGS